LIKIGATVEICLGHNQGNFQLDGFTKSENITKSFRGGLHFWLTLYKLKCCWLPLIGNQRLIL